MGTEPGNHDGGLLSSGQQISFHFIFASLASSVSFNRAAVPSVTSAAQPRARATKQAIDLPLPTGKMLGARSVTQGA